MTTADVTPRRRIRLFALTGDKAARNRHLPGVPFLLLALAVLLAATWTATYTITSREENAALEATAFHAQRLTEFFESHANTTFQYADDYIKAVRRIYLRDGTLESVRQFMAAVHPSTASLSHITMMDAIGVTKLISTG